MLSKKTFELSQVRVFAAGLRETAIAPPARKKFLPGIPLPECSFPLLFGFQGRDGSRSIPVNVQLGKAWRPFHLVQSPGDFVLRRRSWLATVRHYECRRDFGAKTGPENADNQIVLTGIRYALLIIGLDL